MGQIVKRKKKGRPSKADLARRGTHSPAEKAAEPDRRRSLRRRNVRYNNFIDFDDYLDEEFEGEEEEEEDEEEGDERRREKKLKLVLKLNNNRGARGGHPGVASSSSASEEDNDGEEESGRKPLKKRRINDSEVEDEEEEEEEEESENGEDLKNNDNNISHQEERERKSENKGHDSVPGTPTHNDNGFQLPEKRILELILDKLQKKDTYGVYAEPVDLEELPDYLDVIDHPMDFATVRKKLGNGLYSTLEQFESDVFLICSNAMQYNAPETIYHKQARAIQELAKKKFTKLRIDTEHIEKDIKSEQKTNSNILAKKQTKKPVSRSIQESVGSDFSSGATLATAGDVQNGSVYNHNGGYERPSNVNGLVEGNSLSVDPMFDKAEDLSSGKDLLSRLVRKSSGFDENRRATYNLSSQPLVGSESLFSIFESEIKQLIAVGLHVEYSYARSVARFAATLGPVAWKVASQRIQQVLPPGCKFGRGWVGEYEPLPTPVLTLETRVQKDPTRLQPNHCIANASKDNLSPKTQVAAKDHPLKRPTLEGKPSFFQPNSATLSEGKSLSLSSTGVRSNVPRNATHNQQKLPPRSFSETQSKAVKQVELNLPPSSCQHDTDAIAEKQLPNNSAMTASKPKELSRTRLLPQSMPPKEQDKGPGSGLPNGKDTNSSLNGRLVSSSSDNVQIQMTQGAIHIAQGQEQGLTDPVEAMRVSAEKAQKQQKPFNQSLTDVSPTVPSVTSVKNDSNNAAAAAARAWMSAGAAGFKLPTENPITPKNQIYAESLYNPTRQLHSQLPIVQGQFPVPAGMQFINEKHCFPFQAFMRPPTHAAIEGQFQNRPMVFPQLVGNDLNRFQMQSPCQGLSSNSNPKKKQESFPPDLNISFQSPGSPAKQSSGMMVDSQQPDLALQL
ncbi:hypothetical protein K2173_003157 [Erythroxylum novogranatense]|uniref:Bromo domain-containing protein n=1 Tax=Erythroxylum novogranatense TaxID=1862640 RepID=A0AAV8TBN0_9ROSI|nr:hypothetical protein K2173_003157 [Erythroxylum novogranatense]